MRKQRVTRGIDGFCQLDTMYKLGWPPSSTKVTTRNFTLFVPDSNLNLHWPLLLGRGTTQYKSFVRSDLARHQKPSCLLAIPTPEARKSLTSHHQKFPNNTTCSWGIFTPPEHIIIHHLKSIGPPVPYLTAYKTAKLRPGSPC